MNTNKEIWGKSKSFYDKMFSDDPILLHFSVDYEDGLRQGFVHGFQAAMFSGPFEIFPETEGTEWFSCPKQSWNSLIKQRDDALEALSVMQKKTTKDELPEQSTDSGTK